MATEEEKKRNLARINAMIIYGLEKGLWDLLGESALAISAVVGVGMLEKLEQTMGLEIAGEEPQDILTEIGRIFVDERNVFVGLTPADVNLGMAFHEAQQVAQELAEIIG